MTRRTTAIRKSLGMRALAWHSHWGRHMHIRSTSALPYVVHPVRLYCLEDWRHAVSSFSFGAVDGMIRRTTRLDGRNSYSSM